MREVGQVTVITASVTFSLGSLPCFLHFLRLQQKFCGGALFSAFHFYPFASPISAATIYVRHHRDVFFETTSS